LSSAVNLVSIEDNMSKPIRWLSSGIVLIAVTPVLYLLTAAAEEPKGGEKGPGDQPSAIVGAWDNEVRHAVHWSLYQPVQGARLRTSVVHFKQNGDRLTGYSLTPDHEQPGWNKEGRTDFRDVTFANGRLVFMFDLAELHHGPGGRTKGKAWGRVEAELKGDRLIGRWGLFDKESGTELFRGEWGAVRSKATEKK
jgi:hypothetical protein